MKRKTDSTRLKSLPKQIEEFIESRKREGATLKQIQLRFDLQEKDCKTILKQLVSENKIAIVNNKPEKNTDPKSTHYVHSKHTQQNMQSVNSGNVGG